MDNQQSSFGKKWLWVGLIITLLNPIFSGLIIGSLYLTEPGLKKVFAVQGEAGPAAALAGKIKNDLGVEAEVPQAGEIYTL